MASTTQKSLTPPTLTTGGLWRTIGVSLLALTALAVCVCPSAHGVPLAKRKFFTSCLGWGPSCFGYAGRTHERGTNSQSHAPRSTKTYSTGTAHSWPRTRANTLFTSGGWGAGTLGKRGAIEDTGSRGGEKLMEWLRRDQMATY